MMLSPYKFIGLQGSVTSCHEGQSCALPAFDGRICSTHMGHTNFRVLHAAFCFPLYVLDIPAPFSIQQSRGLLWNSTMLSILRFVMSANNIHFVFVFFQEQKFVLGVILMVPCYAVESYVSLVNPDTSVYCGILRDAYEAFAMYCFGRYITACLGELFS
jgi:hypothetical protein